MENNNNKSQLISINNYKNIPILIKLFCFQEGLIQKINPKINESSKPNKEKKNLIILIQKDVMKKFKDIFDYNNLLSVFKKANIIEHIIEKENIEIDYEKLNDESILLNILYILEKYQKGLVNKIESINVMPKINELNFKNKFNYKRVIYNDEDYKNENQLIIKYIDDFEIINLDIFNLLQKLNIKLNPISGDYIIEYKKIYLFAYVYNICEIGNFDKQGNFNIEYLFNINEFGYKILKKYFQK